MAEFAEAGRVRMAVVQLMVLYIMYKLLLETQFFLILRPFHRYLHWDWDTETTSLSLRPGKTDEDTSPSL